MVGIVEWEPHFLPSFLPLVTGRLWDHRPTVGPPVPAGRSPAVAQLVMPSMHVGAFWLPSLSVTALVLPDIPEDRIPWGAAP